MKLAFLFAVTLFGSTLATKAEETPPPGVYICSFGICLQISDPDPKEKKVIIKDCSVVKCEKA